MVSVVLFLIGLCALLVAFVIVRLNPAVLEIALGEPAPALSTVSERTSVPVATHQPGSVMSHTRRRAIKRRQLDGVRRAYHGGKLENSKLKTENQRLRHALDEATKGQRKGVRIYLEKAADKKLLTRSDVCLLLGKDKSASLQLIADVDAELEQERRRAAPVPPEIAQMEPLPI